MPVVSMLPEHREEINRAIVPGFGDRPEARRSIDPMEGNAVDLLPLNR